jgi:hypothetical protein
MARILYWGEYLLNPPPKTTKDTELGILCPTDLCFYCGEHLKDDLVYWHGELQIWLHPECAFLLGWNLIKDACPRKY